MMLKLATILTVFLLVGCAGRASAPTVPFETEDGNLATDPIEDIAAEFRSLRTIKGHFGGGTWNDDVDKWMGRKHQFMIQLGSRLDAGEYSKAQVI
ncbi:MAG: hypothetical protein OEW09_18070, partial [Anaerolineae bacterium]|nr:hypothetical protein [Anaerolineae bacterium]